MKNTLRQAFCCIFPCPIIGAICSGPGFISSKPGSWCWALCNQLHDRCVSSGALRWPQDGVMSPSMGIQGDVPALSLHGSGEAPLIRWWRQEIHSAQACLGQEATILASKAPLKQRKVVNTKTPEGRLVGVNAQQYAVLVTNIRSAPSGDR